MLSTSLLLAASMVVAQAEETASPADHLKCYDGLIGKWVYKGPLQEAGTRLGDKDKPLVIHVSWKRILGGSVVQSEWEILSEGKPLAAGKRLIGWDAKAERIVTGGMGSLGDYDTGHIVFSEDGTASKRVSKGVDSQGRETSARVVTILKDANTLVWQAEDRTGGDLTGDSPEYTFTRCACDEDDEEDDDD